MNQLKDVKVETINGQDVIRGQDLDNTVYNMFELQVYIKKLEACPCFK